MSEFSLLRQNAQSKQLVERFVLAHKVRDSVHGHLAPGVRQSIRVWNT